MLETQAQHSVFVNSQNSRSRGMSQTGITSVNPYGFNNNPAHLALLHKKGTDLQYRSYFLVDQLHYGSISAYYKTSQKDGFGASILYDGSTDLNDLLIGFSYGRKLSGSSIVGLGLHYLNQHLPEHGNSWTIIPEIGIQSVLFSKLIVATVIKNPIPIQSPKLKSFPSVFKLGFNYEISPQLNVLTEVHKINQLPITGHFGLEYRPIHDLFIRAGFMNNGQYSFGLGYILRSKINLDASMELHPVLGISPGIGIHFNSL